MKQLNISAKPPTKPTPDEFLASMPSVEATQQPQEATTAPVLPDLPPAPEVIALKRLAVDIPADLHRRIKMSCAGRGVDIRDVVISILDKYFPAK